MARIIREIEGRLATWHRQSRVSRLLATVPGIGIMGASAIAATVADPSLFRSGREFAAWLAITITADLSEAANQKCDRWDIRVLFQAGPWVRVIRPQDRRTPAS
jgi:transposase